MAKARPGQKTPKKPTKKPAPTPAAAGTAPVPRVRVRMFRHGLGDCFLLTFDAGGDERHMLIDCGTLGNKASDVKIADVAEHVLQTIGTGKLAVVIATHEHQDHLSGFNGPMQQLQGKVEQVWLAWTENPQDPLAQALAKNRRDLGEALARIATAAPASAVGQQMKDVLDFAGDVSLGAAKFAEKVNDAMEFVRRGLGARTTYHNPGGLIEEPSLPGFRFYVLGPPRSREALKDLGSHQSSELYGIAAGLAEEQAKQDLQLPFDEHFTEHGVDVKRSWYPDYVAGAETWRTIDDDWLNLASDLALQLDSMTNNSSLALAIEPAPTAKCSCSRPMPSRATGCRGMLPS